MKKLFTLIAIVLTVQCFSQNSGSTGIFDSEEMVWDLDTAGGMTGGGAFFYEEPIRFAEFEPMVSSDYLYMSDDSAYYIAGQRIITERDIERWIEHCYNDSTEMDYGWISLSDTLPSGYVIKVSKWQHKDPNDIIELLKWLKQTK